MSILRQTFCFSLVAALLFVTAHRLPAPISEIPESPTPAPEQSAKPKPKRTVKPKASESSESSTKNKAFSSTPAPLRNPFDGTWRGIINIGWQGDVDFTIQVSGDGRVVTTNPHFPDWSNTLMPRSDGHTLTWKTTPRQTWTLTPDPDGQTARVTGIEPGFFGIAAFNSTATFRRTSR